VLSLVPGLLLGGLIAALAAAAWLRRHDRALLAQNEAARHLRREAMADVATDNDPQLPLSTHSAEARSATAALRQMVQAYRERVRELVARNVALGASLQSRTHELNTLQDLSIELSQKSDVHELVAQALRALEHTLDFSTASVWARDARGTPTSARPNAEGQRGAGVTLLGCRVAEDALPGMDPAADGNAASMADGLLGMRLSRANLQHYEQIEREGSPIIENQVRQSLLSWLWTLLVDDTRTAKLYSATRSWMAVPLKVRESVLGVLRVDHREFDYFDPERVRLLKAVASQAALAMRHASLQEQERHVAVLAERNRIARDLHDAVSQTLFAANVLAGTLAQFLSRAAHDTRDGSTDTAAFESAHAQAQAMERLTQGALAEMRLLLFELRPDALEQSRMADLLGHALTALAGRADFELHKQLDRDDSVPPASRVHLYRLAQEALSNVVRHAQAKNVAVHWTHTPTHAVLRIVDDGIGFDADAPRPGHYGVDNMRERAEEIGARYTLNTAPGQGTEVCVELDLAPRATAA
jgi:signal transduction histidine kinase